MPVAGVGFRLVLEELIYPGADEIVSKDGCHRGEILVRIAAAICALRRREDKALVAALIRIDAGAEGLKELQECGASVAAKLG